MRLIPFYTWSKGVMHLSDTGHRLLHKPWTQGVLLLICVIAAMLLANLPFTKEIYRDILHTNVIIHMFSDDGVVNLLFPKDMDIEKFINDILMTIFFFTVGLEIKREIAHGELSTRKKALLPIIAAFGGAMLPALIYTAVNSGTLASRGWGIPTATDIAFVVCILTLLKDKVPVSLKIFLTALAIADDLIAILVVALFYGGEVRFGLLLVSAAVIALTLLMRHVGEKRMFPYLASSLIVWILFYYSGIHATMSGVVMAFLIPAAPRYNKAQYLRKRGQFIARLDSLDGATDEKFPNTPQKECLMKLEGIAHGTMDMSYRVERAMLPWVNFLIMPLFALANAGVEINSPEYLRIFSYDPVIGGVSMGIFLGLVIGKPLGITLLSWISIKLKICEMPRGASWPMFFAVACLGGIGFTMSIFIDNLSFTALPPEAATHLEDFGKIAVLTASLCAGLIGWLLITLVSRKQVCK